MAWQKNKKLFCFSNKPIKGRIRLSEKYFAFKNKKDRKSYTNYNRSQHLLKYLNGDKEANNELKKRKFKTINDRKDQSEALLGLALHTLQDYFAHLTKVDVLYKTKIFSFKYEGKKMKCDSISMTSFSNKYLRNTDCFEDATNVLNWRYQNSLTATQVIYNLYKNERCISDIKKNKTGRPRYFPFKAPNGKFFMIRTQEYYLLVT